jgi:CheY-like chemotaxis protein
MGGQLIRDKQMSFQRSINLIIYPKKRIRDKSGYRFFTEFSVYLWKMKILLVEDELALLETIEHCLTRDGYRCESAVSLQAAEEKVNCYTYDVVILDIGLPDGNGLNLLFTLKKNCPETGVLILSAKNSLEDKITGLEWGADDYLTKPFHQAELNARIKGFPGIITELAGIFVQQLNSNRKSIHIIMKYLFAYLLALFACSAFAQTPAAVLAAFQQKYPAAQAVEWETEDEGVFEADFKLDNKKMSAAFDAKGTWLETEMAIKKSALPEAVRAAIAKEFPDYEIDEAEQVETPGGMQYEVVLENEDGDTEIEVEALFSSDGKLLKQEKEEKDDH